MKRALSTLAAGTLVSSLSTAAFAQSVDIVEQNVTVDISGADTVVTVEVALDVLGSTSTLDMLATAMPIVTAKVDGVSAEVVPHPQYPTMATRLTYPTALAAGDVAHLEIVLSGTPSCEAPGGNGVLCLRSEEQTIFTPSSPGSAWYLINLYDLDPFVGTVTVRAPESHAVVAGQGAATGVDTAAGVSTWTFAYEQPTEALGLYAAEAEVVASSDDSVRAYYHAGGSTDPEKIAHAAEIVSQLLPVYEDLFGPLPMSPAHILSVPPGFAFGGMGLLGNVFVGEYIFGDYDYLLEQGMAHEFAHSWWGGLASSEVSSQGGFLNEAFAEYSGWRALGSLHGDDVRTAGVRMNAVWYMYRRPGDDDIAVLDPFVYESPLYVFVTYHKGSVFLRTLEQAVGAEAFTDALRSFSARGYGALSVDALVEDIAAASGYDASADVEQWLYEPGFPRARIGSTVRRAGAGEAVEVVLSIESQGAFAYRLPVKLTYGDGTRTDAEISITAGQTEHVIPADAHPIAVEIDPAWTAVRELTPALSGDVTFDGIVDAADLIEVALRDGGELPEERRVDGSYDPLYDVDMDRSVGGADLDAVRAAMSAPLP